MMKAKKTYIVDNESLPDGVRESVVYIFVRRAFMLRSKDDYKDQINICISHKGVPGVQATGVPFG